MATDMINRKSLAEIRFKPKSKLKEFLGEKIILLTALASLSSIMLIFLFIFKESLPIFHDEFIREEVTPTKMVFKQEFSEGRDAKWSWQPVSDIPKYSLMPLFIGTLKAALIAMLVAVPLGIGAAIYSAEFANKKLREIIKPAVELLAGIPSIVLGLFALLTMATLLQELFGFTYRLNAINAGLALGLAVIPIVFTMTEDALNGVPQSLRDASLALGANRWQVTSTVVIPAALPGISAAVVLGFGRAVGETMIVLMASGNAAVVSVNMADSIRTISASIAAELAEVVFGSAHYNVLFLLGSILFLFTFLINMGGDLALQRVRNRLQGRSS